MKVLKLNDLDLNVALDDRMIQISGAQDTTLIFKSKLLAHYWFFNLGALAKIADRYAIQIMFETERYK